MNTQTMHNRCMASKTISLRIEASERLREARRFPGESFSQVVLRASWPEETVTGAQLLRIYRERGPIMTGEELDAVEAVTRDDRPPEDKWNRG